MVCSPLSTHFSPCLATLDPPHPSIGHPIRPPRVPLRLDEGVPLRQKRDRPHDVTGGEREDERRAPHTKFISDAVVSSRGSTLSKVDGEKRTARRTYVWFSPLGLKNHARRLARTTKARPMITLQLGTCTASVGWKRRAVLGWGGVDAGCAWTGSSCRVRLTRWP